jgi:signal peptidase II
MYRIFLTAILADQITKVIFASRDFFVGPVHFHPVRNYGLSFGLNNLPPQLSVMIVLAALLFFIYLFRKTNEEQHFGSALGLFAGGAVSNLADRFVFGYVRDFIDVGFFTFNFADAFIVIGLVLIVFSKQMKHIQNGLVNDTKKHNEPK